MSDRHLACFVNRARPALRQAAVADIPVGDLEPDLAAALLASLDVAPADGAACAAAARLWEEALEAHRAAPYLQLRVADMRMALSSRVTALALYEELQRALQDHAFGEWLTRTRREVYNDIDKQHQSFKHDRSLGVMNAQMGDIRNIWQEINTCPDGMDWASNLQCLETSALEGIITVVSTVIPGLVYSGFERLPGGRLLAHNSAVQDQCTAIGILQDARKALDAALALFVSDAATLDAATVCRLHRLLMRHSRVVQMATGHGEFINYTNIGQTRQTTRTNVAATLRIQHVKVQFCPYDEVDAELDVFCDRYNALLQQDVCPFAAAAWISHVFVTIHPFEDGNGRLSRILASIPLLRQGLPPLCIPPSYKDAYNVTLNNIRANRDGDFTSLMKNLYSGTKASLEKLQAIVTSQRRDVETAAAS